MYVYVCECVCMFVCMFACVCGYAYKGHDTNTHVVWVMIRDSFTACVLVVNQCVCESMRVSSYIIAHTRVHAHIDAQILC